MTQEAKKAKKSKIIPLIEISTPHLIWKGLDFDVERTIHDCIGAAFPCAELPPELAQKTTLEISFVLASELMVQVLNKQYRNKDKPTNVLSFPARDSDDPDVPDKENMLGDIILSYETIFQEAGEQGKDFKDHFRHLVIHGFLHLSGYDHETNPEAEKMEELEIRILKAMGIKNPYE